METANGEPIDLQKDPGFIELYRNALLVHAVNLSLVADVADRVYVLSNGEIVDSGDVSELGRMEKSYFS